MNREASEEMVKFAKDVEAQVRATTRRLIDEGLDASEIPKTDGMVLVRLGSAACQQRRDDRTVIMVPAPKGADGCQFFVCSS